MIQMRKVFILFLSLFCLPTLYAASDTIRLEFDHFAQGPKYYNSGDWYVVLENEEDWEVYLNWKAPKDDYTGRFITTKFLHDYSYIFTPDNREHGGIHFDNILMRISKKEISPFLEQIELNATITGTDGNIYIVHATHEVLNAKNEMDVEILDAEMAVEDDAYTIAGQNEDWDIALKVNSASVIGTYNSIDYFDLDESHFLYQGQAIAPLQLEAQVGVGYMADSVLAYIAQCNMLGSDTVIYHIQLAVPLADPVDSVNIACANMRIDDTFAQVYNMMTISASNDDYEVQIMYKDHALREQTYTEAQAQVYVTDKQTSTQVESLTCTIHVEKQAAGDYQVRGEARCTNNVVYDLQLAWVIPDRADTVALHFEQTARASYYPQMNNDLLLINSNDRYALNLNVVGAEMGETFTMEQVGDYYTSLYDNELNKDLELAQIDGRIYQLGDTTWIEAEMIGFDATMYDVRMWYAVPEPTDTVELVFEEVPFTNHLEEGYYQLIANTDDQLRVVSFTPASHEVEGHFVNDGLFGRFGKGRYDFFNDYTYIQEWNPIAKRYDTYTVEKGELVVSMAADGSITAHADVICENAICYRITMYSEYERPHLDYDTEDGNVERVYGAEDDIKIEDLTQSEGFIIFQATAQDQSDMMVLYFFANEADDETTIPAGVYPINHSLMAGSVLASTGANEDNTVSPSIYATLTDGYLDQLYFMVDGNVTVEKKNGQLKLEVNALNSYGVPVHVVYDATQGAGTGLDNVGVGEKAMKIIKNGRLIIKKGNKNYNAQGAKIR